MKSITRTVKLNTCKSGIFAAGAGKVFNRVLFIFIFLIAFASVIHAATSPTISVSPSKKVFGRTPIGTTDQETVSIKNTGTANLVFNGFTLVGINASEFSQTNNCVNPLPVGESCTVTIKFTPTATSFGGRHARLRILSNDPISSVFDVWLLGPSGWVFERRVGEYIDTGQYPGSLVSRDNYLYWSENSDFPLNRIRVSGGRTEHLARKIGTPKSIVISGQYMYWVDSPDGSAALVVYRTSLDGRSTIKLAESSSNCSVLTSNDLVVDNAFVYWIDGEGVSCSIKKVPITGGNASTVAMSSGDIMALKGDATNIFWIENIDNRPSIKKVSKSGGEPVTLAASFSGYLFEGTDFAVYGGNLFVPDNREPGVYNLLKVSTDDGTITMLASVDNSRDPYGGSSVLGVAVDKTNVYWTDGSIKSVPINGGSIKTVATKVGALCLTLKSGKVYWREITGRISSPSWTIERIRSMSLSDGTINILASDIVFYPVTFSHGLTLAVDNNNVYWIEGQWPADGDGLSRIAKVPLTGGAVTTLVTGLHVNVGSPGPGFAVDENDIYIGDGFTIKKMPVKGGNLEMNLRRTAQSSIWMEGNSLYWFEWWKYVWKMSLTDGLLSKKPIDSRMTDFGPCLLHQNYFYCQDYGYRRFSVNGNNVLTLVSGFEPNPSEFAVDNTHLYFYRGGSHCGMINRVPLGGGPITTVIGYVCGNASLTVDSEFIYWTDYFRGLLKMPKNGGPQTQIFPIAGFGIIVDDTSVYMPISDGEIWKVTPK